MDELSANYRIFPTCVTVYQGIMSNAKYRYWICSAHSSAPAATSH